MTNINAKLEELKAELAELAKSDGADAVDMTASEYAEHLAAEVARMKKSTGEERTARLAYLNEIIEIGKNYEGPTPGAQSIPMFKDPAQSSHTTASPSVPTTQTAGSNFTAGETMPAPGTPTPPSAGGMPPSEAGASGAPFAGGNFAKSIASKLDELKALVKAATGDEKPAEESKTTTTKSDDKGGEKPAEKPKTVAKSDDDEGEKKSEKEPTAKSTAADDAWPLDMNTRVGLGKAEHAETPEHFFGWDTGSELEREHAERSKG